MFTVVLLRKEMCLISVILHCNSGTGTIYCFGDGQFGQLGINVRQDSPFLSTPCRVPLPTTDKVVSVDCGVAHTAAVTGAVSCVLLCVLIGINF